MSPADKFTLRGVHVVESRWLDPATWGHYIGGTIYTPNAARLAANVHNLGICRRTGKIALLPGATEVPVIGGGWACPICGTMNDNATEFSAEGWCQGSKCADVRGRAKAAGAACVMRPEILAAEFRGAEA